MTCPSFPVPFIRPHQPFYYHIFLKKPRSHDRGLGRQQAAEKVQGIFSHILACSSLSSAKKREWHCHTTLSHFNMRRNGQSADRQDSIGCCKKKIYTQTVRSVVTALNPFDLLSGRGLDQINPACNKPACQKSPITGPADTQNSQFLPQRWPKPLPVLTAPTHGGTARLSAPSLHMTYESRTSSTYLVANALNDVYYHDPETDRT